MSDNPYQPQSSGEPIGNDSQLALAKVSGPSIALIIVGALNIMGAFWGFIQYGLNQLGIFEATQQEQREQITEAFKDNPDVLEWVLWLMDFGNSPAALILNVVGLILGVMVIYGGIQMRQLKGYGLAMTSSIIACVPCLTCCCYGLPIGIWCIVVLMSGVVKQGFEQRRLQ